MMNSKMLNGSGVPDPTAYKAIKEGEKKMDWQTGEVLRHEETGKVFVCIKSFDDSSKPYAVCFQVYDGVINSENAVAVKIEQGVYMYGEVTRLFYVNDYTKDIEKYKVVRSLQEAELTQILNFLGYGLNVPYKVKERLKAEEGETVNEDEKAPGSGAEWLKLALEHTGLKRNELAKSTGISDSTIYNYLAGKTAPDWKRTNQIVTALLKTATEKAVEAARSKEKKKVEEIPTQKEKPRETPVNTAETEALKIELVRWKERAEIFETLYREVRA